MSSRYDYPDPGSDPAYCNQLGGHPGIERHCTACGASVWVSREDPYQVQEFCDRCRVHQETDPAERAAHSVIDALSTLEVELAKASTTDRALALRRLCDAVYRSADRVALAATTKLEELVS